MGRALFIVFNIFYVLVEALLIVLMLHAARSSFEAIVISGLVLIYLGGIASSQHFTYAFTKKCNQDLARFVETAKVLRLPNIEIYEDAHRENLEDWERGQATYGIGLFIRMGIGLYAIWNLVDAVARIHGFTLY